MTSLSLKPEKNIVKQVVSNFFFPLKDFYSFVNYIFKRKERHDVFSDQLAMIVSELSQQTKGYEEVKDLVSTVQNYISRHEKRMISFNKDIADARRFLGRQALYSTAFEDHDHNLATHISLLANKTLDLKTRKLSHGESLTNAAAEIGIANIEFLLKGIAKKEKTAPYLVGINKGGQFLASYLAARMHLRNSHIVDCAYDNGATKVHCEDRDIRGSIVLIDDVTRTGNTLVEVKNHLEEKYLNVAVFSFVLVTTDTGEEGADTATSIVDYSPWVSGHVTVTLPWSNGSDATINAKDYFNELEMDQIVSRLALDG